MNDTFLRFPQFKNKVLTFSYDDGVEADKRLIKLMSERGIKGTFNLNSGMFSQDGADGKRRLSEKEALALYEPNGQEVAAHGYRHLSLTEVDDGIATSDVLEDVKNLEDLFGKKIKGMAYANGAYDDRVINILKACGVKYCRTVCDTKGFSLPADWLRWHPTCHHNSPKLMELAQQFLDGGKSSYYWARYPQTFYLWGHSYEFDDDNNWDVIERFCDLMANRKDVWYATNGEIYDYVTAYRRLEFSANGKFVFNPSATDIWLNHYDREYVIFAGKTATIG